MHIYIYPCDIPILFICLLAFLDDKPFYWPEELLLCSCPNCGTLRSRSHRASGHKAGEWCRCCSTIRLHWDECISTFRVELSIFLSLYLCLSLSISVYISLSIFRSVCLMWTILWCSCVICSYLFFSVIGLIQCLPILYFPVLSVYLCCSICVSTCLSVCLSIVRDNHV